ncbi:major facilitator superfamily domain-containing protein [Clohesyomyces aquaticus]|uniref:Major facilitator superfamily domain-containing protein n=1 Tax=Clohesyomyces aquaticus TaxID=1231657 RepID=A0A1Y1YPZ9_9PLEO|nr:major facilitator superfamily domain-containing protein [Clohesyomyces aquaticus]
MAKDEEVRKISIQHNEHFISKETSAIKLDPHGYHLRPQPSNDPMDPLTWSIGLKLWILFQVSFLAFLGPFTMAIIDSAFHPLSVDLNISIVEASYQTTIPIAFAGAAPLIWSPISNVYGRRPIFIFVTAFGVAMHTASGAIKSCGGILAARCFVGIGSSAGMGIGAAVVADLFFMHERGRYMGFYVVFVSNGAHLAAVIGGFVAKYASWRWCYYLGAISLGTCWILNVFCTKPAWTRLLNFRSVQKHRKLKLWDFSHCFIMLKYPSVTFPLICYALGFGFGSVLFAVTGAAAFGAASKYHFDTVGVGLAIGLSTFVGTLLGELFSGPVSDYLVLLHRKRHDGKLVAEARLHGMWPGFVLLPIGIIIEGVTLQKDAHWMGPVMGIGIAALGLQIVSTNIFAYITDCYKPRSAEISTLLNVGRQTFSFTLGFYALPFAKETSFGLAWGVFAIIQTLSFVPLVVLMWKGKAWGEKLGGPKWDRDL